MVLQTLSLHRSFQVVEFPLFSQDTLFDLRVRALMSIFILNISKHSVLSFLCKKEIYVEVLIFLHMLVPLHGAHLTPCPSSLLPLRSCTCAFCRS